MEIHRMKPENPIIIVDEAEFDRIDSIAKLKEEEVEKLAEELVTLETAKMLREKVFNEPCMIAINIEDSRQYGTNRTNSELPIKVCSQPTQSVAQKWLRETKNLHISIIRNACGYGYDICKADNGTHITDGIFDGPNDGGQWDTYEEALEVGIQEALKLVEEE